MLDIVEHFHSTRFADLLLNLPIIDVEIGKRTGICFLSIIACRKMSTCKSRLRTHHFSWHFLCSLSCRFPLTYLWNWLSSIIILLILFLDLVIQMRSRHFVMKQWHLLTRGKGQTIIREALSRINTDSGRFFNVYCRSCHISS